LGKNKLSKEKIIKTKDTEIRLQAREKPLQGENLEKIYSLLIKSASNETIKT